VAKPSRAAFERGRPHAVVGRDADDVHIGHIAHPQPGGQADAAGVTLETRVRRRVLALLEDRLDAVGVQRRMELDPGRADHAVDRPRRDVVGRVAEVGARVDVVVLGRDDVVPVRTSSPEASTPEIPAATMAPPSTGSEPPSQKSFCTSTMINARVTGQPAPCT
jgi:hypothetical protein